MKIKNIADYIRNIHIAGDDYFNFADCSPKVGAAGVREYLFGKATRQKALMDFAAGDCRSSFQNGTLLSDESQQLNLYYRTQSVCTLKEVLEYADAIDAQSGGAKAAPNILYPGVGIWIARNSTFAMAVKYGDNDDNHNHNDTGSIIVYKNGKPVFIDIGVETYTARTFSPDRYQIWTMQSCYHNLPTIDGRDQKAGASYKATDISFRTGEDSSELEMNLSTAYATDDFAPYLRTVTFHHARNFITLSDTTDHSDVILNFITCTRPVATEEAQVYSIGNATVRLQTGSVPEIETLPVTDARLKAAWEDGLYRIRIPMHRHFMMQVE